MCSPCPSQLLKILDSHSCVNVHKLVYAIVHCKPAYCHSAQVRTPFPPLCTFPSPFSSLTFPLLLPTFQYLSPPLPSPPPPPLVLLSSPSPPLPLTYSTLLSQGSGAGSHHRKFGLCGGVCREAACRHTTHPLTSPKVRTYAYTLGMCAGCVVYFDPHSLETAVARIVVVLVSGGVVPVQLHGTWMTVDCELPPTASTYSV